MPRCNGSYIGIDANPTNTAASGMWTVREAESLLRAGKWPANPAVPGSPTPTAGNGQVSLTWTAPSSGGPAITDYVVQYSSNGGSTWTTFSDGVSTSTSATVTGLTNGTAYIFRIQAINALGEGPFGSASASVTPSVLNVALLLHMDGSNGSTTFTDSSPNNHTAVANGGAVVSASKSKFGGASLSLDGATGSYVAVDAASLPTLDGDFTIDFWAWTADSSLYKIIIGTDASSNGSLNIELNGRSQDPSLTLALHNGAVVALFAGQNALPQEEWVHIAFVRSSGVIKCFVNGSLYGSSVTSSTSIPLGPEDLIIGAYFGGLTWNGYLDEVRIVDDSAVWFADFTPPTAPY